MELVERKYTVYMHTAPNGKRYVGITSTSVTRRWGRDGIGYKWRSYFWSAICRHGWANIIHEVVSTGLTEAEAKQSEKDLIIAYKTRDPSFGYNLTDGGDGACGCIVSAETRAKLSVAGKGRLHSEETKRKMSAKQKGRIVSAETCAKISMVKKGTIASMDARAKMSAAKKGRTFTAEHRAKIGAWQKGRTLTAEHRANICKAAFSRARAVECLTLEGAVIGRYVSGVDAEEKTGIDRSHIGQVCLGKATTAGKFRWRYV